MRTEDFIYHYPELYHVTTAGAWPSIAKHGLMSASAALDHFGILGSARVAYESRWRPRRMSVFAGHADDIVLHDQRAIPRDRLLSALAGSGLSPEDWYRIVNAKVYFWPTQDRLYRQLDAADRRDEAHDVLVVSSQRLLEAHGQEIALSSIVSGSAMPLALPRSRSSFRRVGDYPSLATGRPSEPVAEVVMDDCIYDIERHVTHVLRLQGNVLIGRIR